MNLIQLLMKHKGKKWQGNTKNKKTGKQQSNDTVIS